MRTPAPVRPSSASDEQRSATGTPRAARRGGGGALVVGFWMLAAPAAFAQAPVQPSQRDAPMRFDISARPLSAAIEAYALATGVQVLYDRPRGEAVRSPGAVGLYTREAALRALLAGAGLDPIFTDQDSVVLRPSLKRPAVPRFGPPPSDAAVLPLDTLEVRGEAIVPAAKGDRLDLKLYGGLVSSAVHQALMRHRATADGRYLMTLKLWIGSSGEVERLVTADSSGDRERDLAVANIVRQVVISAPPPEGLPQPVVLVVRSRAGA